MAKEYVSERIIRRDYKTLNSILNKELNSRESEIFVNDGKTYKIIKPIYRPARLSSIYLIEDETFPHANNIKTSLYQGDKFIGVSTKLLEDFISLGDQLESFDLYEVKIIFEHILEFIQTVHEKKLDYWDIHLENMGTSNGNVKIIDIDSMNIIESQQNIQYCYTNLLTLFYEMCFKLKIRQLEPEHYRTIIYLITGNEDYIEYKLNIDKLKRIIDNTTEDFIDEQKRYLLK